MKKLSDSAPTSLAMRTIDAVDRAHAHLAMRLHDVRNQALDSVKRGIDRAEVLSARVIERARDGLSRFDHRSADAINRAQGAVGHAIEKARLARATPVHVVS